MMFAKECRWHKERIQRLSDIVYRPDGMADNGWRNVIVTVAVAVKVCQAHNIRAGWRIVLRATTKADAC